MYASQTRVTRLYWVPMTLLELLLFPHRRYTALCSQAATDMVYGCVCGRMRKGCAVSGSDVADSARLQALRECGADVRLGHDAAHLAEASAAAAAGAAAAVVVRFPP